MNHQDLFAGFFGGAAGIISSAEAMLNHAFNPKSDDITMSLDVSLTDIYLSKKKSVVLERKKGCVGCRGSGRVMTQCRACHGNGITMCTVQPFPGYIQQVPQECQLCRRTGYSGRANCPTCHGLGVMVEKRPLDIRIPKDCRKRHDLVYTGLGHHLPGEEAGDGIVILCVKEHPVFTRRGCHLFLEKTISLTEAMCGVQIVVATLDGRSLLVRSRPSSMIKPSSIRVVESEGMPIASVHEHRIAYGNLYIKFNVTFPDKLTAETCERIRSLLPAPHPFEIDRTREDVEEVGLMELDPGSQSHPADQDSDEEYGMGSGVQCVHQ